jgi:hypothetical protein
MNPRKMPMTYPGGLPMPSMNEQLPLWPDQLRGVPWAALRSALFAPVRPGARAALRREKIAAVGDFKIIYTGIRLDQADLDVYERVLHLARKTPLGEAVKFRTRDMLADLGRPAGKSGRDWLLKSLSQLAAGEIEVSNGKFAYAGSLIQEQGRDEEAGLHYIVLNPRLTALYGQGWSAVRQEHRLALGKQQLAKWLHGFIQGQRHPLTWNIREFEALANAHYKRSRDFRNAVGEAVESLNELGLDVVVRWDLKREKVTVTRGSW